MIRSCVRRDGADRYGRRCHGHHRGRASAAAVRDEQSRDVCPRNVGHEHRRRRGRAGERGGAAWRRRRERPQICQRIAVRIERAASVERDLRPDGHQLIRTGVRDRRAVHDNAYGCRVACGPAVADHQRRGVGAARVGGEGRRRRCLAGQHGAAVARPRGQRPLVGENVAVRIGRPASVERHDASGVHELFGAGVGRRRPVRRHGAAAADAEREQPSDIVGGQRRVEESDLVDPAGKRRGKQFWIDRADHHGVRELEHRHRVHSRSLQLPVDEQLNVDAVEHAGHVHEPVRQA